MIHFMTWMTDICKPYLPWQQSKVCIINKTKCSCIPESFVVQRIHKRSFLPSQTTNYYLKINLDCDLFSILQRTGQCVVRFQTWAVIAPTLTNIVMFNMFFRFNIQKRLKQLIHGFTNVYPRTLTWCWMEDFLCSKCDEWDIFAYLDLLIADQCLQYFENNPSTIHFPSRDNKGSCHNNRRVSHLITLCLAFKFKSKQTMLLFNMASLISFLLHSEYRHLETFVSYHLAFLIGFWSANPKLNQTFKFLIK